MDHHAPHLSPAGGLEELTIDASNGFDRLFHYIHQRCPSKFAYGIEADRERRRAARDASEDDELFPALKVHSSSF